MTEAQDESPMSVGTATVRVQGRRTPPSGCPADTLQALTDLDDEIVEDGLPEIRPSVRKESDRIIVSAGAGRGRGPGAGVVPAGAVGGPDAAEG